jgi:hypothetical protein
MIVIRTAEEMARALDSPLDPELRRILAEHWARLADYDLPLSDLAEFLIAQPADTLAKLETASGMTLIAFDDGRPLFALGPEIVEQHVGFLELVFILSDDGFGVVLLVSEREGMDPILKAACERELNTRSSTLGAQQP